MKSTQLRKRVLLVLIGVPLVLSLATAWYTGDWGGLALNLCTEMIGAAITYYLFNIVIGRIESLEAQKQQLEARKADLIAQMGSRVKDVAIAAAEELRRHGWLTDGSLRGAFLGKAKLQEANLGRANLQGAHLVMANLQGVNLGRANLQGADLVGANLQGAFLVEANLQEANLRLANLRRADLWEANPQGARLYDANLQGAEFNKYTTLPDGTKWTPDTDMARFTDPNPPDFWRPEQ